MRSTSYTIELHARKFRQHRDPARLLAKYSDFDAYASRQSLLRHTCHVCSWVVSLPRSEDIAVDASISPVRVLTKLMRGRKEGPLTPRLRALLQRVRTRIADALGSTMLNDGDRGCWEELQHSLPRQSKKRKREEFAGSWGMHTSRMPALIDTEEISKEIVKRQSHFHDLGDQQCAARQLLSQAREAQTESDAARLHQLLLTSVSCLAKPRMKPQASSGNVMDNVAKDRLKAAVQATVRRVVLICLNDLAKKPGALQSKVVRTSLLHIHNLIDAIDLKQASSKKQWLAIHALLVKLEVGNTGAPYCNRSYKKVADEGSTIRNGVAKIVELSWLQSLDLSDTWQVEVTVILKYAKHI